MVRDLDRLAFRAAKVSSFGAFARRPAQDTGMRAGLARIGISKFAAVRCHAADRLIDFRTHLRPRLFADSLERGGRRVGGFLRGTGERDGEKRDCRESAKVHPRPERYPK